jgi:hypothetical protein
MEPLSIYTHPTNTRYVLRILDETINMPLTFILLLCASLIVIYLANKVISINNDVDSSVGNMTPGEYKAHTVSIHQFMVGNSGKIIKYLKANSDYFNLLEYIIYIKRGEIDELDEYLDEKLYILLKNEYQKYGNKQFNLYRNGIKYFPVCDGDLVLFSNYPQLTFLKWVCQIGLDYYITKNFEKLKNEYTQYKINIINKISTSDTNSESDTQTDE